MGKKFTQGPWHVGGYKKATIYCQYGTRLANSFEGVMAVQHSDAECKANAQLIAAAPELLEALESCASLLEFLEPEVRGGYSPDGALSKARAAIAKALGEKQ